MKTKLIFSAFVLALLFPINTFASFGTPDLKISTNAGNHVRTCSTQDGHVYVVWNDSLIRFNFSTDFGKTWLSTPITISVYNDGPLSPDIDCSQNGHVYIVWYALGNALGEIAFRHSPDHGVSWDSVKQFHVQYFADFSAQVNPHVSSTEDGHVYLVWQDPYGGAINKDIFFNHSNDFGATWQPSNAPLNFGHPGFNIDCNDVVIESTQDGHVYVAWTDTINTFLYPGTSVQNIYFTYSNDYGSTWPVLWQIDHNTVSLTWAPSISKTDVGHVYIAWVDNRTFGLQKIYFNQSNNYGSWDSWQSSDTRLDFGSSPVTSPRLNPKLGSTSDGHVYAIWQDYRNNASNGDLYFNYSSDYGVSWSNPDIRIDLGDTPGQYNSINPVISNDNIGNVYVAFEDARNGGSDILFNASNDHGANWYANPLRVNTGSTIGSGAGHNPALTSDSTNHIYVAWEDTRSGSPGVYFNYSPYSDPLGPIPTLSSTMFAVATLCIIMLLICIIKLPFIRSIGRDRTLSK